MSNAQLTELKSLLSEADKRGDRINAEKLILKIESIKQQPQSSAIPQQELKPTARQQRVSARTGAGRDVQAADEKTQQFVDYVLGIPGALPAIISSLPASMIGGIGATGEMILSGDPDRAVSVLEQTQQALTIPPIGEKARQTLQTTAETLAPITKPIEEGVDIVGGEILEATGSPAAGALFETVVSFAPDLVGAGLAAKGIKSIRRAQVADDLTPEPTQVLDELSDTVKNVSDRSIVTPQGDASIVYGPKKLSKSQKEIVNTLNEYPSNPDLAAYIIGKEGKPVKSKVIQDAIDLYGDPAVVGVMKASGKSDKKAISEMIHNSRQLFKDPIRIGKPNVSTHRTVIGNALTKRAQATAKVLKEEGKKIDNFVQTKLSGNRISLDDLKSNLQNTLENKLNATYDPDTGVIDYAGSALDDDQFLKVQKTISRFANKIKSEDIDARQAHIIKKQLDNLLDFDSVETGISGDADRLLKDFRAGINQALRDEFKEYELINQKFSDHKRAFDNLQNAFGKKINLDKPDQLGNELRKLASQYQKGELIKQEIYDMEKVLSQYGNKFDDDIVNLVNVGSYLERRFPWMQKIRSFEQSVRSGNKDAMLDVLDVTADVATGGQVTLFRKAMNQLRKEKPIDDDKTMDALLKMLKESDGVTTMDALLKRVNESEGVKK